MKNKIIIVILGTMIISLFPKFKMASSNPKIYIDNKEIITDSPVIIKNSRALVPIRFIAENLGFNVYWDNINKHAVANTGGLPPAIEFPINSNTVYFGDMYYYTDVSPQIINNRTYVPLRLVVEVLNSTNIDSFIDWNENTKAINIYNSTNNLNDLDIFKLRIEKANSISNNIIQGINFYYTEKKEPYANYPLWNILGWYQDVIKLVELTDTMPNSNNKNYLLWSKTIYKIKLIFLEIQNSIGSSEILNDYQLKELKNNINYLNNLLDELNTYYNNIKKDL